VYLENGVSLTGTGAREIYLEINGATGATELDAALHAGFTRRRKRRSRSLAHSRGKRRDGEVRGTGDVR
jgi:hypothetical protein